MGADNELTAKLRFLSGVLRTEGAINASDDVLRAVAEIDRQRGEVEARITPEWVIGYFPADVAEEVKRAVRDAFGEWNALSPKPAPAMPNGVDGLAYAQRLAVAIWSRNYREVSPQWEVCEDLMGVLSQIDNMVSGMSAADNRDAAGVAAPHWCKNCLGVAQESCPFNTTRDEPTPAAVPAVEAVAVYEGNPCVECGEDTGTGHFPGCCLGTTPQPADGEASMFAGQSDAQIAHAVRMAEQHYRSLGRDPVYCNVSLSVLRDCTPPAPVQAAPQEGGDWHAFKNFHRSLCARFGYTHDENDWRRDLASLEEHIARMVAHPSACELGAVRDGAR